MSKQIKYYLNGKEVDRKVLKKRKAKLDDTHTVVHKYYEAPLTKKEKEEREVAAKNSAKFFNEMRETRQQMELYHG